MRWRLAALLAVLMAGAVPALSVASSPRAQASHPVTVKPGRGGAHTHFVVSFHAPVTTGHLGGGYRRYSVAATGPQGQSCQSSGGAVPPAVKRGKLVRVTLRPQASGWCTGTYRGTVLELLSPECAPERLCPMFVAVVLKVGSFVFHVR
jgi:hypothetical protein